MTMTYVCKYAKVGFGSFTCKYRHIPPEYESRHLLVSDCYCPNDVKRSESGSSICFERRSDDVVKEVKPRPIEYRGLALNSGEYVYGFPLRKSDGSTYILQTEKNDIIDVNYIRVLPESLSQCTFLKDESSKLIYENDKVEYSLEDGTVLTGNVVYSHGAFGYKTFLEGEYWMAISWEVYNAKIIEEA